MTADVQLSGRRTAVPEAAPIQRPRRAAYVLSVLLIAAASAAAGLTVAYPSLLTGVAGSNGNLRGTAVVVLAVGVPVLIAAVVGSARGSARAFVVWLGTLGYLLYQAVLLCFATPLNNLFLFFYVAYLGLAVWSLVFLLRGTDLAAFGTRLSPKLPVRYIAGYARADPASSASSMAMVPAFAAVALITAVPLVAFLRNIDRSSGPSALPAGRPDEQVERGTTVPAAGRDPDANAMRTR